MGFGDRSKKGQNNQALGRSRGGFSTKIHLKTGFGGLPIAFISPAARPATVAILRRSSTSAPTSTRVPQSATRATIPNQTAKPHVTAARRTGTSKGRTGRSSTLRLGDSVALSTRIEFSVHTRNGFIWLKMVDVRHSAGDVTSACYDKGIGRQMAGQLPGQIRITQGTGS